MEYNGKITQCWSLHRRKCFQEIHQDEVLLYSLHAVINSVRDLGRVRRSRGEGQYIDLVHTLLAFLRTQINRFQGQSLRIS
jgi:hypothetical protein